MKVFISDSADVYEHQIAEVAAYIKKSRRAIVITGAGISCSSGIPDFRSTNGLYNLVKARHPNVVLKGAELFDATLFNDVAKTQCFYTFMAELKTLVSTAQPTPTHHFLRNMQSSGQLLRLYTQNIDDLEHVVEVPVVQLHGTMATVKCTLCSASYKFSEEYQNLFREGEAPACPKCEAAGEERMLLGKRQLAMGSLRPDIVLYNEDHPDGEKIGLQQVNDIKKKPDLLIVLGTSLKIPGIKKFIKLAARTVRNAKNGTTIFVNKTPPTKEWENVFDFQIMGDADAWVKLTESKMQDAATLKAAWDRILARRRVKEEEEEEEKENRIVRTTKKTSKTKAANSDPHGQTTLDNYRVTKRALGSSSSASSATASRIKKKSKQ
ncbi:dhs-like nad fad-binding domain-containingprotein [Lichtheimia corymbifera JMRC:FSU:9682]|uniref:Dhs-like nad fad-binding domain-containingprotein n=1 Tax=Lichtheimia corymbifera JMRC:FSU:9682 TaxID=1263082 RepID=A0A068RH32_9FUNG|nr:dhs-like nad fad-binding domain-containingprotein [Lichtheimia corymbifera JMRC:FSU:9682]